MKLIDKDAIVVELKKLQLCTMDEHMNYYSAEAQGEYQCLSKLASFIDTLEVKEVDLEKKATQLSQKYFPNEENIWARPNIEAQRCKSACIEMVEWLKTQKGE